MRVPNTPRRLRSAARLAALVGVAGAALLGGCGSSGGSSAVTSGLAMHALWQKQVSGVPPDPLRFDGSAEVPPSVQTIEVRVSPPGIPAMRAFAAATGKPVQVNNIPASVATVQLFGYDVPVSEQQAIVAQALPPSFVSGPKSVQIAPYDVTDAGVFELVAQPFVTEFDPLPGATGVSPSAPVEFVIATAVGAIDRDAINIDIDGLIIVRGGVPDPNAGLLPCDDAAEDPCSTTGDQGLSGFLFFYDTPTPYPPETPVGVSVSAADSVGQSVTYNYGFTTGAAAFVTATRVGAAAEVP